MSKAFVAERDDDDDDAAAPSLPSGDRNYVTPQGFAALKAEHDRLLHEERPAVVEIVSWAAGNGDRSENGDYLYGKKRLREIDRRLRYLANRLKTAIVVDPARQTRRDQVFFGATVTYVDEADAERTVTIVGKDEVDPARGLVSWISPVARGLMRARVGDGVILQTPRGPQEIEVVAIRYPAA